jgi:hypothetical protein
MYPTNAVRIVNSIGAGDKFNSSVTYNGSGGYKLTVTDQPHRHDQRRRVVQRRGHDGQRRESGESQAGGAGRLDWGSYGRLAAVRAASTAAS